MNSIAAFQMAKALDEERLRYVERRSQRAASKADGEGYTGRRSWLPILRFPRAATAPSKG
jgi:hypothetical protein